MVRRLQRLMLNASFPSPLIFSFLSFLLSIMPLCLDPIVDESPCRVNVEDLYLNILAICLDRIAIIYQPSWKSLLWQEGVAYA